MCSSEGKGEGWERNLETSHFWKGELMVYHCRSSITLYLFLAFITCRALDVFQRLVTRYTPFCSSTIPLMDPLIFSVHIPRPRRRPQVN